MSSKPAYLKSLEVINLGPIEKFQAEFSPGLTLVVGDNATGKSTVLKAIMTFFNGGAAYNLVRRGQLHAEATIEWSDGFKAIKTMDLAPTPEDRDTYEVNVWGPAGEVKKRVAEALNERVPKSSFDPQKFLDSDPRERAAFLSEHLQLTFTPAEINAALETPVGKLPNTEDVAPAVTEQLDLGKFNELFDTVYESRRVVNVQIRDADGAIADLQKSLPPESDRDWRQERARIQAEIVKVSQEIAAASSSVRLAAEQARTAKQQETHARLALLQDRVDAYRAAAKQFQGGVEIFAGGDQQDSADLIQWVAECGRGLEPFCKDVLEMRMLRKALASFLTESTATEQSEITAKTAELNEQKARLSIELGTAEANADRESQADGIRKAIATRESQAGNLRLKEMRRTAVLAALEKVKHEKLRELPIRGFDLKYDSKKRPVIVVNGTPLEDMSSKEALFFALQAISFAHGQNPLMVFESSRITEPNMELLAEACAAADPPIQLIAERPIPKAPLGVERVA